MTGIVLGSLLVAVLSGPAPAAAERASGSRIAAGVFLRELSSFKTGAVPAELRLTPEQSAKIRAISEEFGQRAREHAQGIAAASARRAEAQKGIGGAIADRDKALGEARKNLEEAQAERERIRKAIEASKPGSPEREALRKQRDDIIAKIDALKTEVQRVSATEREKIDSQREKRSDAGSDVPPAPDFEAYRTRLLGTLTPGQKAELEKRLADGAAVMDDLYGPAWAAE